jgi:hypothetical protein
MWKLKNAGEIVPELEKYWQKDGDDTIYSMMCAGTCPPSHRPGVIVVAAEEFNLRPPRIIRLVDETQVQTLDDFFQQCLDFQSLYQIDEFVGRTKDEAFMQSLIDFNRRRRERGLKSLEVTAAPNSNDSGIGFHIGLLRQRLKPGNKKLILAGSSLDHGLREIPMSEINTAKDSEHPLVAAAGYVVSYLDLYSNSFYRDDQPDKNNSKYDELDYFNSM